MTNKDLKNMIHLFGVEDGSFKEFSSATPSFTIICGVETELDKIIDVRLAKIQIDGADATQKLLSIIKNIEVNAVILGGITFAGFNIIDPNKILNETGIPVIIYSGTRPDNEKMLLALKKHFDDWHWRWDIIKKLGPVYSTRTHPKEPPIYFEVIGCSNKWGEHILQLSAIVSRIPEPVRTAGIIARGLSKIW